MSKTIRVILLIPMLTSPSEHHNIGGRGRTRYDILSLTHKILRTYFVKNTFSKSLLEPSTYLNEADTCSFQLSEIVKKVCLKKPKYS